MANTSEVVGGLQSIRDSLKHGMSAADVQKAQSHLDHWAQQVQQGVQSEQDVARSQRRAPKTADAADASAEAEPSFHGHPLSFYDDKDDDKILGYKGIGEATLKQIRDAQKKRDSAAKR